MHRLCKLPRDLVLPSIQTPCSAFAPWIHTVPQRSYKYTSSFGLRSKKRLQMGENCSSAARALTRRIMRSECRQECVEEWSWQGFTSLNYSKPIPSLIKPFSFFFLFSEGALWRCLCLNVRFKLFLLHEQILVDRILLFQGIFGVPGFLSQPPLLWLFWSTWHFPAT